MNPSPTNRAAAVDGALDLFPRQPLFWAGLAYVAGITLAGQQWRPVSWWMIGAAALIAGSAIFRNRRNFLPAVLALTAFFFLGAAQLGLHRETATAAPDISDFTDGQEVIITAHVVRTGLPRQVAGPADRETQWFEDQRQVIDVQAESIEGDFGWREVAFGIRVTARSQLESSGEVANEATRLSSFQYGERVRFVAKLRAPRNYGNPGAMDYRGYLHDKGIWALASVPMEHFEKLEGVHGPWWGRWRDQARTKVIANMLAAVSPEKNLVALDREDASLLLAMVIGEQSLLERSTRSDFQRTGAFHILVVSGMNVGIVAFFVYWMARRSRANQWLATAFTLLLTLAYVAVTDLGTPVLRAALMLGIYLVTRLLYRDKFSLNAVGTAALLLLLFSPQAVFEPSFQLTFVSMVVLGGMVQPLMERTSGPYRHAIRGLGLTAFDATLPPRLAQFRLDLRLICARISRLLSVSSQSVESRTYQAVAWMITRTIAALLAVYELLMVSILMQVALALPMTVYFHRMAILGVPTNILILPLTAVLMPVALLATVLQSFSALAAKVLWSVTALCLHGITMVVQQFGGLQFADHRVATPSLALALTAALVFLFAVISLAGKRNRWLATTSLFALLISAVLLAIPGDVQYRLGVLEFTAIDVGQGDSLLLVSPEGKTLLVDGGGPAGPFRSDNFDIGEDVVSPYLWSRGITRLHTVAVTHAHSDHLAGMFAILANFRPQELWIGAPSESPAFQRLLQNAQERGVRIVSLRAGDHARLGAVNVSVLSPAKDFVPSEKKRNEDSLVLQAAYGETSVLLTGDAERKTEASIAISAAPSSVLKVAHHGSGTSTTQELLEKVRPKYAVISAGYLNLYGHPRSDVLTRLREAKARTYRTDIQGAVTFYLDGKQVSAEVPSR